MKKLRTIVYTAGIMAIAALAMVSCSKEESAQAGGLDRTGTISVSVSGLMGEYTQNDETKAGLVSNVRVSWKADDKVYAFDGTKYLGDLKVSLKDGKDYYALLSGELLQPVAGTTKITLVYASGYSATQGQAITDGKLSFDISSQSSGSDSKNTPFVAFGTLDYTEGTPNLNEKVVDFTLATTVMRLNCTGLEASAAITGATLIGMSNECVLNVTNTGAELGQGAIGNISLSFADGFNASESGAQVIYAGIAKNGTASAQTLEVNQSKTYEYNFGSKTREACKSINAICQLTEKKITIGPFTVSESSSIDPDAKQIIFAPGNLYCKRTGSEGNWTYSFDFEANQYDYRTINDGTLKGKCVINGVEKSETDLNTSGLFQWNCKNGVISDDYGAFTKESSIVGAMTDKMDWGIAYNVQHSGENWRTLTNNEWKYLIGIRKVKDKTGVGNTCVWATLDNGVYGLIIFRDNYTGPTSGLTSIPEGCAFLSAAGYYDVSLKNVGSYGAYWSSTPLNSPLAYCLYFHQINTDAVSTGTIMRNYKSSVRLVSEL